MDAIAPQVPQRLRRPGYPVVVLLAAILLAGGAVVHSLYGYTHSDLSGHAWGSDDAYISYRYARNLAEGRGLVFNPGERVEGYSNFLYVLLMALGYMAGLHDASMYPFATFLNLVFMLGALLMFARFMRRRMGEARSAAAALLFAVTPAVWVWVGSGMETALVVLLQLALFIAVEDVVERETRAGISLLVAVMMASILARADGFIAPLLGIVYLLLRRKKRAALTAGLAVTFTLGVYVLCRVAYYGYPFPNTFYVKVSDTLAHRLLYAAVELARLAIYDGFLLYLAAIALGVYRFARDLRRSSLKSLGGLTFATFFSVGWLGYWLYIGGDYFDERFLLILIPLALYTLMQAAGDVRPRALALPVIMIAVLGLSPLALDARFEYSRIKYDRWITLGQYLKENRAGQILAIDAAGKTPFFSGLTTIDILGLNDPVISHERSAYFLPGHNKFDPDYILSRRPDLIAAWMAPCDGDRCDRLDLILGMSEDKYVSAGYRIRYLLNTTRDSMGGDILDVSGMSRLDVLERIFEGRGYGVLERVGQP